MRYRVAVRFAGPRHLSTARTDDVVLVVRSWRNAGNEQLPDSGAVAYAHGMPAAVPGIEIADDGDPTGVRRPDGETHAIDAVDGHTLGAEAAHQFEVPPLVEQMKVEVA